MVSKIKVDEVEASQGSNITFNHTPKVDTISEKTSGSGVTIDGALIKDSQLAATAGGGLVKILSINTTGSTYTFDNVFDSSTYLYYLIEFQEVKTSSDNVSLRFNWRSGGASGSDVTGGYYKSGYYFLSNASNLVTSYKSSTNDYAQIAATLGTASFESFNGVFEAQIGADSWSTISGNNLYRRADGINIQYHNIMGKLTGTVITGIKFYMTTGNVTGTITIYGVKR